ncbi:type IV pilin protein [Legionella brunensis]|uniref:Type-IV pilin n=1 Tax=Legionella brunensis TaxID=29422 RepID=A0A0W0SL42_9GAMM|nr:type IV pilin protein [Legionella brunensis]KTC84122.1 Type-IV pilin [Legionella brunensis]
MLSKGFSLIELMTVIIIMGILICFAYPSYRHYILHTRRYDGQLALLDLANRLEHFYAEQHTYETATLGFEKTTDIKDNNLSQEKWYLLKIASQTVDTYSLQAIPRNSQVNDLECQTLTLDHLGVKSISPGPKGTPIAQAEECW